MKLSVTSILTYIGVVAVVILLYFTLVNRMYAWTMYYFLAIMAISFYNFLILGFSFIKNDTDNLKISIVALILSLIPFVYFAWSAFRQFSATL